MTLFLLSFSALLSVINPFGTLPIFLGLTQDKSKEEIFRTARKACVNTFVILLISFFIGDYFLTFFGISLNSLKIAGGLIIASSGFALLTGNFSNHKGMKSREKDDAFQRSEISLTPIAIPMLAGPGTISLLITAKQEQTNPMDWLFVILALFCVCILTLVILMSSKLIMKSLGASGINAVSRIIGFIVIAIGVEYIKSSVVNIIESL